jgi:hypothetical protein
MMGMSTHVVGFLPPDEDWRRKRAAWHACADAGVGPPKELEEFFGYEEPGEHGREVKIHDAISKWSRDGGAGYEVDLSRLPPEVKVIRFWNS